MAKDTAKRILLTFVCVLALSAMTSSRVMAEGPSENDENAKQSEESHAGGQSAVPQDDIVATPPRAGGALPGAPTILPGQIRSEIIIPGSKVEAGVNGFMRGKINNLAVYMDVIYKFLVSIVGVVAAFMIMVAGFQYLTAGGDANKVTAAKARIGNAMLGLILTLTSYVLLSTINPALVQLNPKALEPVETKLAFLPWCDDLAKQNIQVKPISNFQGCGAVGSYIVGSKPSGCIYYGTCRLKDKLIVTSWNPRVATCMQIGGLKSEEMIQNATNDPSKRFAVCIHCASITPSVSRDLGYGLMADACQAWQDLVNGYRTETPNSQFWSICQPAGKYASCVQVDINCRNANDNEDVGGSDPDCSDGSHSCGCEGYDDQPTPVWTDKDDGLGHLGLVQGGQTINSVDTLDSLPVHLGTTCSLNPCRQYIDDRKPSRPRAFENGCRGDNGVVFTIQRVVRHGDFAIDDCRNKGR